MDEWINILIEKFQEILILTQAWWVAIGAVAGSYWLIIKKSGLGSKDYGMQIKK